MDYFLTMCALSWWSIGSAKFRWQQLSESQLLVEPLKASNPCPDHCVARALSGPCATCFAIVMNKSSCRNKEFFIVFVHLLFCNTAALLCLLQLACNILRSRLLVVTIKCGTESNHRVLAEVCRENSRGQQNQQIVLVWGIQDLVQANCTCFRIPPSKKIGLSRCCVLSAWQLFPAFPPSTSLRLLLVLTTGIDQAVCVSTEWWDLERLLFPRHTFDRCGWKRAADMYIPYIDTHTHT